jgi:DNA-binding LacI/PurR family transcriptional regulator
LGHELFERLWERGDAPTGLVCFNDAIAMGVLRGARSRKIQVPDELSVVGFDDVDSCAYTSPPLSTVRVQKEELGVAAMRIVHEMIGGKPHPPISTRIGVELIVRQSTATAVTKLQGGVRVP